MMLKDISFFVVDLNSGRYVLNQDGHERDNLEPNEIDNRYYGYCPPHDGVNIQKLGAKHGANSIDNVMVIYTKKLPNSSNRQIVAFSDNVTAYNKKQYRPSLKRRIKIEGEETDCSFSIESDYLYDLSDYKKKFVINIAEYNEYMFRMQRFYKGTYPKLDERILNFLEDYLNFAESTDDAGFQEEIQNEDIKEAKALTSDSTDELLYTTGSNGYQITKRSRIAKAAIIKSGFKCAGDEKHVTFRNVKGEIYLEGHHLIPCTRGNAEYFKNTFQRNIDCIENIVPLCPNCHRLVHFGGREERNDLLKKLYDRQMDDLKNIGIDISLDELLERYKY